MPDSMSVAVVRRLYEARCNPDIIREVLAPDIRWEVVKGFPHSGVFVELRGGHGRAACALPNPDSVRQERLPQTPCRPTRRAHMGRMENWIHYALSALSFALTASILILVWWFGS